MDIVARQRMDATILPILPRGQRLHGYVASKMKQRGQANAHFAMKCVEQHILELGLTDGQNDVIEHRSSQGR
jgi:hypothetical protein